MRKTTGSIVRLRLQNQGAFLWVFVLRDDFVMVGKYSFDRKKKDGGFFPFHLILSINKLNREISSLRSYFRYPNLRPVIDCLMIPNG